MFIIYILCSYSSGCFPELKQMQMQHMAKIMPATIIARTTAPPTAIAMITPVDKPE